MEFYDKELIDAAAKEIGFPAEIIADRDIRLRRAIDEYGFSEYNQHICR